MKTDFKGRIYEFFNMRVFGSQFTYLFPKTQTIVEPFFTHPSLLLSGLTLPFKVRILNDRDSYLVKLFELYRIDDQFLREILKKCLWIKPEVKAVGINKRLMESFDFSRFFGESPFVNDTKDIYDAFDGYIHFLNNNHDGFLLHEKDPILSLKKLHERLQFTFIENLPVVEFIPRFNRTYTLYFLPIKELIESKIDEELILQFQKVKGLILCHDELEDVSRLATFIKSNRLNSIFKPLFMIKIHFFIFKIRGSFVVFRSRVE
ncbi:MAG: hypothetical protein ACTSWN_02440 [Promethearchaeota archaeon]